MNRFKRAIYKTMSQVTKKMKIDHESGTNQHCHINDMPKGMETQPRDTTRQGKQVLDYSKEMITTFIQYHKCFKEKKETDMLSRTMKLYTKASNVLSNIGNLTTLVESQTVNPSLDNRKMCDSLDELYHRFWVYYVSDESSDQETRALFDMMYKVMKSLQHDASNDDLM